MRPVETIPGMRDGRNEGEWWRGWIELWYVWYFVRTLVNATIHFYQAQEKKKCQKSTLKPPLEDSEIW
jgi:hypothetical protein